MNHTRERLRDIARGMVSQKESDEVDDSPTESAAIAGEILTSAEVVDADKEQPEAKATELESEDDNQYDVENQESSETVEVNEEQIQE